MFIFLFSAMRRQFPNLSFLLFIALSCILPFRSNAQYKISGQLKNYDSLWLNKISVSAIDSLKHLLYASSDMLINKDSMDKNGYFTITGNNLPDENRIYRFDLTNQGNSVAMLSYYNHFYLILNNQSSVKIYWNNFSSSPFNYLVEGSEENATLQKFEQYVSGLRKLLRSLNSKSEMGKVFAQNRFNTDIRNYCDSCKYPIIALMALSEITDFRKDYTEHTDFYNRFLNKIQSLPDSNSVYVKEFEKKLSLLDQNHPANSKAGYLPNLMICLEGVVILLLLGFIWYLKNKTKPEDAVKTQRDKGALFETLTRREKEILALLIEDIQNKEIAGKLNLEVSTIKTHIGKIYQKLDVSNRNEVKAFTPYLKNNDLD